MLTNSFSLHFNEHVQASKCWKKQPTFNNSFPLGKQRFTIEEYVSTFVISKKFWFLMYRWKIYTTLYIRFYTIIFNNIMMKVANILSQNYHFWLFTSAYYYLYTKDKQPELYVSLSCCLYNLYVELIKDGRYS